MRVVHIKNHSATSLEDLPRALTFDEAAVIQSFRRDPQQFDDDDGEGMRVFDLT